MALYMYMYMYMCNAIILCTCMYMYRLYTEVWIQHVAMMNHRSCHNQGVQLTSTMANCAYYYYLL